ncbi:CaiB/BaiF CoA transferase family protein, partial [Frankia canadensis]|uniref:CaiB/BaiF CoA transferase family protein n=1 Tax=Frankia canadensis TaxID=1836972 RepID=UPI000C7E0314
MSSAARRGAADRDRPDRGGPLGDLRVVELASLGPVPFASMVLAGLGADVVRVDRSGDVTGAGDDRPGQVRPFQEQRGKRSVAVDLRHPDGPGAVLDLVAAADVFLEGYRPGIAEAMGLGPSQCLARNPRLVYGRATGWGRSGPYAGLAGHDINYLAVSGLLGTLGPPDAPPPPPLNVVGDYAAGGYGLALAVLAAARRAEHTGTGQVVDVSMLEAVSLTLTRLYHERAQGNVVDERGANLVDGGAPFYNTYETADGRHVAVGAVERKFYAALLGILGLDPALADTQWDRASWPRLRAVFAERFRTAPRDAWTAAGARVDACVSPVLSPGEAVADEHNRAVDLFTDHGGVPTPRPLARFSVD